MAFDRRQGDAGAFGNLGVAQAVKLGQQENLARQRRQLLQYCIDALQGVDGVEFSSLDNLLATLEYKAASTKRLTFARGDREPPPPRPHAVEKVYETVDVVVGAKLCGNQNFTAHSC